MIHMRDLKALKYTAEKAKPETTSETIAFIFGCFVSVSVIAVWSNLVN